MKLGAADAAKVFPYPEMLEHDFRVYFRLCSGDGQLPATFRKFFDQDVDPLDQPVFKYPFLL
jgi:hypothetical protein